MKFHYRYPKNIFCPSLHPLKDMFTAKMMSMKT